MNDNDLERQLRAQAGPREEGYMPTRLPASPDDSIIRRPAPLLRAVVLVPAVAAGVLAVAIAGSMLRGTGTANLGGAGSQTEKPIASPSAPLAACDDQSLEVSAEPWGGAAGSRGTVVTFSLAPGMRFACDLAVDLHARLTDANGVMLVEGSSGPGAEVVTLQRGSADFFYTVGIAWSNWCAADPARPVTLSVRPANTPSWIVVPTPDAGADPVPPCMGEAQSTNLSVTELQPAS